MSLKLLLRLPALAVVLVLLTERPRGTSNALTAPPLAARWRCSKKAPNDVDIVVGASSCSKKSNFLTVWGSRQFAAGTDSAAPAAARTQRHLITRIKKQDP